MGKTTLLKSLMGVVPVKTGTVLLDGAAITHATPYERVRGGMGYVPQGREIFPHLTVEENLRMSLLGCRRAAALDDALALFPTGPMKEALLETVDFCIARAH